MVQTRGSDAIDKAQRRIALLTSIDANLDLGYGLTVGLYREKIESSRTQLEVHDRLKSDFDESCKAMKQTEKELSELSERMLNAVAVKYGRNSVQYQKAGGKARKNSSLAPAIETSQTGAEAISPLIQAAAQNGATMANN